MKREEAIKQLNDLLDYCKSSGEEWEKDAEAVEMAIKTLEEQRWIPCSERLPKKYAQYLVCLESGECYVYWLTDSDWARCMAEKEGILAWMPLPKPYREEGEQE